MPLEELIMCFLLANASLNKLSVLVTGACQSLVHFSFTHPFYVRTVYKRVPGEEKNVSSENLCKAKRLET